MGQDWFEQNQPKSQQSQDWFDANAPKSSESEQPKSMFRKAMDAVAPYLPSGRTAAQVGGATIGGAAGSVLGPFGTVAGGALGGGAGDAAYQLGNRLLGGPSPQTSGEAAGGVLQGATGGALQEGIGEALPRLSQSLASRLYRTSLKPSTTLTNEEAQAISNTLLKERAPISDAGMRQVNNKIGGLNQLIDAQIATKPDATISPFRVARRVEPAIQDFEYKDLQPDARAATGEQSRFIKEHSQPIQYSPFDPNSTEVPQVRSYQAETPIPANRAQTMKKAIYQELSPNDFGTVAEGYKQARKMEARGLKEELQSQFPAIQGLNEYEGRLLEARPALQRAVNRTENRDVLGIGAPITSGAVNALTGSPTLALAAALAKNSGSRTAILLDRLAGKAGPITPAALPRFATIPLLQRLLQSGNQ